jgi:PAS domain S-box-containing protein
MQPTEERASPIGDPPWWGPFAFVVVSVAASRVGLLFASPPAYVPGFWPAAAVALAGALFLGRRAFPLIWVTTLLAGSFWGMLARGGAALALTVAGLTATGSTLSAFVGAWLLRRFGGPPSISRVRSVLTLTLGAGMVATAISAAIGVGARFAAGLLDSSHRLPDAIVWWLADGVGVVIVAPLILAVMERPVGRSRPRHRLEAGLLGAATLFVVTISLTGLFSQAVSRPLSALLLPLLFWPAFRFGPRATSLVATALGTVAVWGPAHGVGPFSDRNLEAGLVLAQMFLIVHVATGLTLAAAVAERREAVRRLRETTSLLVSVTEGTPDVVFVKDREGRYLMINAAGARYTGRRVDDIIGRKDEDIYAPDMARQILEFDRLVLETGETRTDEYAEIRDGARITYLATKGATRDAQGNISGIFGISRDITERKLERNLLHGILEGTSDLVGALDHGFRFVAFNSALQESYRQRYGVEITDGARLADLLGDHPEALARQLSLLGRALRGEVVRTTWALPAPGAADVQWYDVAASPLRDETGYVIGSAAIARDVTASRATENALKASQGRFRSLTLQAPVGIFETDVAGCCTFVNEAWCSVAGLSAEEAVGEAWNRAVHPRDLARVVFEWEDSVERGQRFRTDFRFLHRDGRVVWVTAAAAPLRDARAVIIGGLGTVTDVTDRRRAEEEVQRASEALAAANRELESFSYSVSHDLRTPLRGIDGFSRALEEDFGPELPAEARDHIARIRRAARRMAQIIDDLLALSRLARHGLVRERVDLSSLARDVDAALRATEPDRDVEFHVGPGLVTEGDGRLLRLLLENLLGNAWKYTSRRAKARIDFGAQERAGERAYFVRDDGAGFDMTYADKLFGAFQRLHSASEFPGSGIGLATAARIVHRHGGRVWAEGHPDQGATFYFTLGEEASA